MKSDIKNFEIGVQYPTKFIAEIGTCHEGSISLCKEMISAARDSGADFVKTQIIQWDKINFGTKEQKERYKRTRFSWGEWMNVFSYAEGVGIPLFASFFETWSLERYAKFMPCFKVASRSNQDVELISKIMSYNKPIFISSENYRIFDRLRWFIDTNRLIKLYCISEYPVEDINKFDFRSMPFSVIGPSYFIGFSDHSRGTEASLKAYCEGARVIEKHFTTVRNASPDSSFALMPHEFKEMVVETRRLEGSDG